MYITENTHIYIFENTVLDLQIALTISETTGFKKLLTVAFKLVLVQSG